jgi:L-ribulokinase
MTGISNTFNSIQANHEIYKKIYVLYKQLHDGFGIKTATGNMFSVMKELLNIRDEVRRKN